MILVILIIILVISSIMMLIRRANHSAEFKIRHCTEIYNTSFTLDPLKRGQRILVVMNLATRPVHKANGVISFYDHNIVKQVMIESRFDTHDERQKNDYTNLCPHQIYDCTKVGCEGYILLTCRVL